MPDEKAQIRNRAFGAVLKNAIFSWQVAFTIAFTMVLYFLVPVEIPWWQDWFWLIGGGLATAGFIGATLTDPQAGQEAVHREFERQHDVNDIKSRVSRERIKSAIEYRRNMLELAARARGAMKLSLTQTVDDVNAWIGHMHDLALHIDAFDENELVKRDREIVPQQIKQTEKRIEMEMRNKPDSPVLHDLENQLRQLRQQQANLDSAFQGARRAEIQLESTLSSLGTIYAQMANLGTKEVDSGRAQRLRVEIREEISSLEDTISAMDEVQVQTFTSASRR